MIELLVVIAIIAILAALLLPVLGKAKQKAQGIQCMSNLHQLTLAWILYADDFNDILPRNGGVRDCALSMTDPNINNGNWVHGVMGILYGATFESNTDIELVKAGSLFRYSKNTRIYKCPADKKVAVKNYVPAPTTRSLSMNAWLNPIVRADTAAGRNEPAMSYKKMTDIIRPSPVSFWVFIDECPGTINDGFFVCDPWYNSNTGNSSAWVDMPASYHNNAGGISFADGHAEIKVWHDPSVLAQTYPPGTMSRQNPPADLNWLQEKSTTHR